jgi:photosystem II stability/assembly factor-like uncharacterized protein
MTSTRCLTLFAIALFTSASACSGGANDTTGSGGGSTSSATSTGGGGAAPDPYLTAIKSTNWTKLANGPTVSGGAKQDDAFFFDANVGFVASGPKASIFATTDGGATWTTAFNHPGTYFRALYFTDPQHGFAGNIGAGLSSQITDATLIYETKDGGATWAPVTSITGSAAQGVCNFTAIDATHLVGVGRANGPAHLLQSSDGGASWVAKDLSQYFSMIIDAHFSSVTEGVLAGMDASATYCTLMRTTDGGDTFAPVFTSKTKGSLCWKLHFPSDLVGYAAVQDTAGGPGTFAKTKDGGKTWEELPLPALAKPTAGYSAIGVGFITDDIGWIAAEDANLPVYRTFDGGATWEVDPALTSPINRFRFIDKHTAYAVGAAVWKLQVPGT